MQLMGLLTGKAMANLHVSQCEEHEQLSDHQTSDPRQQFRLDRKKPSESYSEWADRLRDRFSKWKDREISVEKMILLELDIVEVPEALAIWLKEKEPKSLTEAAELADAYALAREDGGKGGPKKTPPSGTAPRRSGK